MLTNDTALRDYLLGRLSESEAEQMESAALEDEELFLALRATEGDLFDELARGELDESDRQAFLSKFGSDRKRIAFADALAHRNVVAFPQRRRWIAGSAAAAAMVILAVALWFRETPEQPVPVARVVAQAPKVVQPVVATVTLALGTSRSSSETQDITIPAGASSVEFRVRLHPEDRFDRYSAELTTALGEPLWRGENLHSVSEKGVLILPFVVPAGSIASDGSFELAVHGDDEPLGFVEFKAQKK
jgi:hypothetical protein